MIRFLCLCFFLFSSLILVAQQGQKYAVLLSKIPVVTADEKKQARNNFKMMYRALQLQGFKKENIRYDTTQLSRQSFFRSMEAIEQEVKRGDFVLIYSDLPVSIKNFESGSWDAGFQLGDKESFLPSSELFSWLSRIPKKLNAPDLFFVILDSDWPAHQLDPLKRIKTDNFKENISVLQSGQWGQASVIKNDSSVFTNAVATVISSGSNFMKGYQTFYNNVKKQVLLSTALQEPQLEAKKTSKLFNGLYKALPPHIPVTQKKGKAVMINAGLALAYAKGDRVRFFRAFDDTTAAGFLTEGSISDISTLYSTVQMEKELTLPKDSIWAYVIRSGNAATSLSMPFNENYEGLHTGLFKDMLAALKSWSSAKRYLSFVNKGGELAIRDIINQGPDSVQVSIVNPSTGLVYERLTLEAGLKNLDPLQDLVEKYVQYNYLSKLQNHIPELAVKLSLQPKDRLPLQQENGYPIFFEDAKATFTIVNNGTNPLYYGLIDMQPDRVANILAPLKEYDEDGFMINPSDSISLDLEMVPPFGIERIKVFTSLKPLQLSGFRQYNRFQQTRGNSAGFNAPEINVQTYEFEIRSRAYARNDQRIVPVTTITKSNANNSTYNIQNPSADRLYINLLKQKPDGNYEMLLPAGPGDLQAGFVDAGKRRNFRIAKQPLDNEQLFTVYADRPFNLQEQINDQRDLNDLLLEILRNGKIPGTALNKIGITHQLYEGATSSTQRDGSNLSIRLITPKATAERGAIVIAKTSNFDIAGLAYADGKKPVKAIRINGIPVAYDRELNLFETSVKLVNGKNKISIEAIDDKGFSISKLLELQLDQPNQTVVNTSGKNYFLGIGIDRYKAWPPLFNATKDVVNFAGLLNTKFGFAKDNIMLLLDTAATRKNIIQNIRSFLTRTGPNDNVIIYLSGHGNEDQLADGDYYFIPYESDPSDVSTSVSSTDIVDKFKKISARHCILIVDACYSGMITNAAPAAVSLMSARNGGKELQDLPSKWIITSGRATKVSDGVAGKNSPFASAFINYLSENNLPAQLKITRIINYLKEAVPKMSNQEPVGIQIDGQGEMIFISK